MANQAIVINDEVIERCNCDAAKNCQIVKYSLANAIHLDYTGTANFLEIHVGRNDSWFLNACKGMCANCNHKR